jgi:hypothetical protein
MGANRTLESKPLSVEGSVERAESSIDLERFTSRNSTDHDYSYVQYALRRCAKSGMPDLSGMTKEVESIEEPKLLFDRLGVGGLECQSLERVQKI